AKTRVLQALAALGEQVLDLEALACHKGSILGHVPGVPQPAQTRFETLIATALETFDLGRPVYIEGESRRIGRLTVPEPLISHMRASPCLEIDATPAARLEFLLRDYAYLGDDRAGLIGRLEVLKDLRGKAVIARWQAWADSGELRPLFTELMALHYDPLYSRSQNTNFSDWTQRQTVATDDLSPAGVDALARALVALGPA
ncbi:MAG: hypothetical protein RLZZ401_1905, partial [Pseudomonadota bacterium]